MTVQRTDAVIRTRDGVKLAAWIYRGIGAGPRPAIVLSHGFSALRKHGLPGFAEKFAAAGFTAILYDHRGFGDSEGEPRQETDPFRQCLDMRDVITFACLDPMIDKSRIGIWGTSYSGGHVLVVAATDRRVKCVVSVVPVTSGSATTRRLVGEMNWAKRLGEISAAREAEMKTGAVQYQQHSTFPETIKWFTTVDPDWPNKTSVMSHDMFAMYEPVAYMEQIAPTPLMMILTDNDTRVLTDLQLEAYQKAREPKRLVLLKGGHYTPYIELFEPTAKASVDWFVAHLGDDQT